MKKIVIVTLLIISLLLFLVPPLFAAENPVNTASNSSVGATPGILPTSPFYFLKEIGRGVRKAFTFNQVSKASYELDVLDIKASELRKLEELIPKDVSALQKAIANYQANALSLKERVVAMESSSEVDTLLERLIKRSLDHSILFEELNKKHFSVKSELATGRAEITNLLVESLKKANDKKIFGQAVAVFANESDKSLVELEIINVLSGLIEATDTDSLKAVIKEAKENMLLKFNSKVETGLISPSTIKDTFDGLSLDSISSLRIVDEVRNSTPSSEVKNELNALRPLIIREVSNSAVIKADDAKKALTYAAELISKLETDIKSGQFTVSKIVTEGLDKARFNLTDAQALYITNNFSGSFAQPNAASTIAEASIASLAKKGEDFSYAVDGLKVRYDYLYKIALENKADSLTDLFKSAEKLILNIQTLEDVKKVKTILFEIESKLGAAAL